MESARPNILFIMSDDHAAHAMGCYGSAINRTPSLDRIAAGGMRFDNCFCTNSICTPSRATILAGTYSHVNGVKTLRSRMDNNILTFPKLLRESGYQTALFGKWHLGEGPDHCPTGFDDWAVLPGQGFYHNPKFIFKGPDGGSGRTVRGYVTDIITDMCLEWLDRCDRKRPFCLLCHHKAPHRPWYPDEKHARLYLDGDIPEPATLCDDYAGRASAVREARMRVGLHMETFDVKCEIPDLPEMELRRWAYQRYIKDYLRVIASVDDNVGRLLDRLDAEGVGENTVVIYTSDQGFFLGDHGWYDKRFMYEESLRMPFILRYPRKVKPGTINADMVSNVDFAPLFLDLAGLPPQSSFQGRSFLPLLQGRTPPDWPRSLYYRYWMHKDSSHNVYAHYGIRTKSHKLIYYYADGLGLPGNSSESCPPEWELFDLAHDPREMNNVYGNPAYARITAELKDELKRMQIQIDDEPYVSNLTAGS